MNILLTNDDGITAPGIWAAARALAPMGRVLIVAPSVNCSGFGMALPPASMLAYARYDSPPADLPDVTAFSVLASPAVCTQVGLSGALSSKPIDLVVSGINDVQNLGRDVLYSGTVGAAFTAHLRGMPAIAVSLDAGGDGSAHWETAGWALQEVLRSWDWTPHNPPMLVNLNVPNRERRDLAGFQTTGLCSTSCIDRYDVKRDGDFLLRVGRKTTCAPIPPEPASDAWAVAHGYVSLTPLQLFPDVLYLALSNHIWPSEAAMSDQLAVA